MIRVERGDHPAPEILSSPEVPAELERAKAHFEDTSAASKQAVFDFEPKWWNDSTVRAALNGLFHGKCAFCESKVGASAVEIMHHFRPKQEAVGAEGEVSRPHYWWLVYSWDNMYLSCQRCATSAGARFPVAKSRGAVRSTVEDLRKQEGALLIDPCHDDPEQYFLFDENGTVASLSDRGKETIKVYNLNRGPLRAARKQEMERAVSIAKGLVGKQDLLAEVNPLLKGSVEYAAAVRQAVGRWLDEVGQARDYPVASKADARIAVTSLGDSPETPTRIGEVVIRNFRGIADLKIELVPKGDSAAGDRDDDLLDLFDDETEADNAKLAREPERPTGGAPWAMLLGENGFGKTSILYSLAIALMGGDVERRLRGLKVDVDSWIRDGAELAEIEVTVISGAEPRTRTLRVPRSGALTIDGDDTPASLAAYGASRIPPVGKTGPVAEYGGGPRIENLFDPHAELMRAREWLVQASKKDDELFNFAVRALKTLMVAGDDTTIVRKGDDIVVEWPQGPVSIDRLSDGYRAMIVLGVELIAVFCARSKSMDAARGILLIDELGAHLHPTWQMRIVTALRSAFREVQVIATTHDPLCLRGMRDREVVVLQRSDEGVVSALDAHKVPPVRGLRVDQLLTSEVFGLNTTVDPVLDGLFTNYYALLVKDDRSDKEAARFEELKIALDRYRQFGATRRERLALEAADELIARERILSDPERRSELVASTRERLRRIWDGSE